MKNSATAGALSGCLIWVIVFGIMSACLLPIGMAIGGFSSGSDTAARVVGGWECPKSTTPQIYSYDSTMTDSNGVDQPATAYELHCVDSGGNVVKNDPVVFAFIWEGLFAAAAVVLAIVLAFVLAAPAGVLIGRMFNRTKTT
jgi:hypothetical protein